MIFTQSRIERFPALDSISLNFKAKSVVQVAYVGVLKKINILKCLYCKLYLNSTYTV